MNTSLTNVHQDIALLQGLVEMPALNQQEVELQHVRHQLLHVSLHLGLLTLLLLHLTWTGDSGEVGRPWLRVCVLGETMA